ncbi:MAG: hypothetical protein DRG78_02625 [Epsilonproteobacteria bacterium]|nr:MAG: hypothetical protein DRG78_02625 [Campylobacterota bacterium]
MREPKTIIELGFELDADEADKVKKLIELVFEYQEIEVHRASDYMATSDFCSTLYDQMQQASADEMY